MDEEALITQRGTHTRVEKRWGYEIIYANSPLYCGKMLSILPGRSTSLHFHARKHEHILVQEGLLRLHLRQANEVETLYFLRPGDCVYVPAGVPHRLGNNEASEYSLLLIEFSTEHFDNDSIRLKL